MSEDTALLVIDVQVGMFAEPDLPNRAPELLATIRSLLDRARAVQVPVIYIQHGSDRAGHPLQLGTPGWPIHPAIAPLEGEPVVGKRTPDSFHETTLLAELEARGIRRVVLTGLQTELCVDTTCRRACSLGYDVVLVADGHSTWDTERLKAPQIVAHHNAILGDWFATLRPARAVEF